jgi:hypothetical protein
MRSFKDGVSSSNIIDGFGKSVDEFLCARVVDSPLGLDAIEDQRRAAAQKRESGGRDGEVNQGCGDDVVVVVGCASASGGVSRARGVDHRDGRVDAEGTREVRILGCAGWMHAIHLPCFLSEATSHISKNGSCPNYALIQKCFDAQPTH